MHAIQFDQAAESAGKQVISASLACGGLTLAVTNL
jgi:hypothetical protein